MRWKVLRSSRCASPETIKSAGTANAVASTASSSSSKLARRICAGSTIWHMAQRGVTVEQVLCLEPPHREGFGELLSQDHPGKLLQQRHAAIYDDLCRSRCCDQTPRHTTPYQARERRVGIKDQMQHVSRPDTPRISDWISLSLIGGSGSAASFAVVASRRSNSRSVSKPAACASRARRSGRFSFSSTVVMSPLHGEDCSAVSTHGRVGTPSARPRCITYTTLPATACASATRFPRHPAVKSTVFRHAVFGQRE